MKDWRADIVRLVGIKQAIADADTAHIWEHHLPKVAATEDELSAVERHLGFRLEPSYRNFLRYANGWPSFLQTIDLFGTDDLLDGGRMMVAGDMLSVVEGLVLDGAGLDRDRSLPIAAAAADLDIFLMPITADRSPPIVWIAGQEIDRFASFDEFVASMIEYNVREFDRLRTTG